ncbi:helix-turn-helix transcriptional regulator [Corynebacterium mendelii]|uniref:WYL domain-containing protein n=1 Tax=Corynebacterium mendelii TaxID=2765362 RepID=A0A939DZ50_9CORY|nr:WYL domain-containing protein [Corynebacterium mendelii]MBN9643511.1 WYL domain-containing protein [Corynebacterium mendelii]
MKQTNHSIDTARRISLVRYLKQRPTPPSPWVAAEELGVDQQTLKEDLKVLGMVGLCENGCEPYLDDSVLIDEDEDNYQLQLTRGMKLGRSLRLSLAEAGALVLELEQLRSIPGVAEPEAIESALNKLLAICGKRLDVVIRGGDPDKDPDAGILTAIAAARQHRTAVSFDYLKESDTTPQQRTIDPYVVFFHHGHRYVAGFDRDRQEPRNFRLDRVSNPVATDSDRDPRADKFAFDDADPFNFDEAHVAKASVAGHLRWLADYEPIQISRRARRDGLFNAVIRWHTHDWITSFVLSQGGGITVDVPDDVRRAVAERAQRARAAYPS